MKDRVVNLRSNQNKSQDLCLEDDYCIGILRLASYFMTRNQARDATADSILEKV